MTLTSEGLPLAICLILALALGLASPAQAQHRPATLVSPPFVSSDDAPSLDEPAFLTKARQHAETGTFSGVLLARRGDEEVRFHAGIANAAWNVPMAPDARFEIYSVSKTVTAVAILASVERGRLALDRPFCEVVDFCPDAWESVTVRHLLTHRSGIPSVNASMTEAWTGDFVETLRAVVAESMVGEDGADDLALQTAPGEAYRYSNFGYRLLAATLEVAWSEPLSGVLDRLVFTPAGMEDALTAKGAQPEDFQLPMDMGPREASIRRQLLTKAGPLSAPRLVSGYDGSPETLIHVDVNGFTNAGASGVYATADDLAAFLEALFVEKTLLGPDMLEAMMTPAGDRDSGYGLGLNIRRTDDGLVLFHTGGINGFQIHAGYYPNTDGMVIYMSNHGFAPFPQITRAMEAWAMDAM